MKVKGTTIRDVEVEISQSEIQGIVRKSISENYDWKFRKGSRYHGYHLNKNKVVENWEKCGGSHCWFEAREIREANKIDIAIYRLLEAGII